MSDPIKPQNAYEYDQLVSQSTQMAVMQKAKQDADQAAQQAVATAEVLRVEREKANIAKADATLAEAKLRRAKRVVVNNEAGLFTKAAVDRAVQETGKAAVEATISAMVAHLQAAGISFEAPREAIWAAVSQVRHPMKFTPEEFITRKELAEQLRPEVIHLHPAPVQVTVEPAPVNVDVKPEVTIPATREEMYVTRDDQGRLKGSVKTVTPIEE